MRCIFLFESSGTCLFTRVMENISVELNLDTQTSAVLLIEMNIKII